MRSTTHEKQEEKNTANPTTICFVCKGCAARIFIGWHIDCEDDSHYEKTNSNSVAYRHRRIAWKPPCALFASPNCIQQIFYIENERALAFSIVRACNRRGRKG